MTQVSPFSVLFRPHMDQQRHEFRAASGRRATADQFMPTGSRSRFSRSGNPPPPLRERREPRQRNGVHSVMLLHLFVRSSIQAELVAEGIVLLLGRITGVYTARRQREKAARALELNQPAAHRGRDPRLPGQPATARPAQGEEQRQRPILPDPAGQAGRGQEFRALPQPAAQGVQVYPQRERPLAVQPLVGREGPAAPRGPPWPPTTRSGRRTQAWRPAPASARSPRPSCS